MDFIITLVRFPMGVIALLLAALFWVMIFLFETLMVGICLPVAAVAMNRDQVKDSFIGKYPQSDPLKNISKALEKIRSWVLTDWQTP